MSKATMIGRMLAGDKLSKADEEHLAAMAQAARERSRQRQAERMERESKLVADFEAEAARLVTRERAVYEAIASGLRELAIAS
jgi:hypothetical protein